MKATATIALIIIFSIFLACFTPREGVTIQEQKIMRLEAANLYLVEELKKAKKREYVKKEIDTTDN